MAYIQAEASTCRYLCHICNVSGAVVVGAEAEQLHNQWRSSCMTGLTELVKLYILIPPATLVEAMCHFLSLLQCYYL